MRQVIGYLNSLKVMNLLRYFLQDFVGNLAVDSCRRMLPANLIRE
jgi:hypothetical protein